MNAESVAFPFAKIDATKTIEQLGHLLCTLPLPQTPFDINSAKFFRWSFVHILKPNSIGTIEFRQPAGSKNAAEAIAWVLFAIGFVHAAIAYDVDSAANTKLQGLKAFVASGVKLSGYGDERLIDVLFEGKTDDMITTTSFGEEGYKIVRPGALV
jgi:hypothetical protein